MSLKFVLDVFNELINVIILLVLMQKDQKFLSTSILLSELLIKGMFINGSRKDKSAPKILNGKSIDKFVSTGFKSQMPYDFSTILRFALKIKFLKHKSRSDLYRNRR